MNSNGRELISNKYSTAEEPSVNLSARILKVTPHSQSAIHIQSVNFQLRRVEEV